MANLIQIVDWSARYENNRTRGLRRMDWVPVPNQMDGDGYTELLRGHANGAVHYAAWMAILLIASRCAERGTLLRDNAEPHDSASLSRMSSIPQEIFDEALPRLAKIRWITIKPLALLSTHDDVTIPHEDAALDGTALRLSDYGTEGNGRERNVSSEPVSAETHSVSPALMAAFERCMDLHPNQTGRMAAERTFVSGVLSGKITLADAALMEPGMRLRLACEDWTEDKRKFLPKESASREYWHSPAAWFRDRAWMDKPAQSPSGKLREPTSIKPELQDWEKVIIEHEKAQVGGQT